MTTFTKDQFIFRNEVSFLIVRPIADEVQLENAVTGELSNHKIFALLREYSCGELYTVSKKQHRPVSNTSSDAHPPSLDQMAEAARIETRRRVDYIVRLNDIGAFGGSRKALRQAILEISQSRQESRPPYETTVYRWNERFLKARKDIKALFARIDARGSKDKSRLKSEVEAIIHEKIETVFLARKCGSAEEVHNAVFLAIQRVNTTRTEDEHLQTPGLRTIQRRIAQLYAYDLAVARYGTREAERRFGCHLGARRVLRILEIAEIDHTPVDLMVVNEKRIVIGRPTITVVLDRYSRCVLGYHLSLAGHGTPAVFEALRHTLLPKTYMQDRYSDLNLVWPCYGWIERLLMDNGREFHAEAVADALTNLGIVTEYAASHEPNDKPHVERFLKTFNYTFIHRLPGTTLAKTHERIGFKAEDDACITLEELDRMIHAWINGAYHLRPHSGLNGRSPIDVWNESAKAFPPQLKANADDIDIEFSEVGNSRLQHYGIDLNTFCYVSERLLTLRRMLPEKAKVDVKWPRHDVGYIWVWDSLEKEYFKVPNKDESYAGLTLDQAKEAKKKITTDPAYKQVRATAEAVVRDISNAALTDKKLKNRRKGARFANQTSKSLHLEPTSEQQTKLIPQSSSVFPESAVAEFEVESIGIEEGN